MIRKSKLYARPQKPFEKVRIEDENKLLKEFGLKNKREVWKTLAKITYFRKRAMTLAKADSDIQNTFFVKLQNLGLNVESTADVLDLKAEDLLQRRLPTIVFKKSLANTPNQARQMVVHKKVLIDKKVVNSPSYIVPVNEEEKIELKEKKIKTKVEDLKSDSENQENQDKTSKVKSPQEKKLENTQEKQNKA